MTKYSEHSVLLFLPESDFSEAEYLTIKKRLEKKGYKVFITSDAVTVCKGDRGLRVKPDVKLMNIKEANFSSFVLIGGKGVQKYFDNEMLHNALLRFRGAKKKTAAICAAPVIFARAGLLQNIPATCHPSYATELKAGRAEFKDQQVVVAGSIITARDYEASVPFADALL